MAVPRHHKLHAPGSVACGVITISDSRTPDTDDSGRLIRDLLTAAGHTVPVAAVVKDDADAILAAVSRAAETCDAILTNGGTGLAPRDVTIPTLAPLLERTLPGFGELFRALSYEEVGSAALLSGALAGVFRGRLLVCLPGSPDACRLALEKLVLPELGHAIGLLRR
ncbi:MAG: MogA/MoaB family molybdenum cofactor biosynthesis protein [Methanobacteriota archaeon]